MKSRLASCSISLRNKTWISPPERCEGKARHHLPPIVSMADGSGVGGCVCVEGGGGDGGPVMDLPRLPEELRD